MADDREPARGQSALRPLGPQDPTRLGGYELLGRLGTGGQGVVFLGRPDGGGPRVAIKLLHGQLLADAGARARFVRELALLQKVAAGRGFCTAQMIEADMEGDQPYIVSEFVPGPSLRDLVRAEGPRAGADLDRLAIGTVTALTAIHAAGVVHRDFKPQNVLMGPDSPRVIDFGIARALDAGSTVTSQVVGTPAYMAPEQFTGTVVGPAADLFAWAATILFAATGRDPFAGGPLPAVMYRIMHDEPDLSALPPQLCEVVAACLAKDPRRRPSAEETLMWLLGDSDHAARAHRTGGTGSGPRARPGGPPEGADPFSVDPVSASGPTPFVGPPPGADAWSATVPADRSTPPPEREETPGGGTDAPRVPTGHLGHRPGTAPARTRDEPRSTPHDPTPRPPHPRQEQPYQGAHPTPWQPHQEPHPTPWQPHQQRPQAHRPAPETGTEPTPGPAARDRRVRRGPVLVLGLLLAGATAAFDVAGAAVVLYRPDLTPGNDTTTFPLYAIPLIVLAVLTLIGAVLGLSGSRAATWTVLAARVARVVLLGGWSLLATVHTADLALHASAAALVVLLLAWALHAPSRR